MPAFYERRKENKEIWKKHPIKNHLSSFTFHHSRLGFTLIELMVAISIIAIIATIGLVTYSNAQKTARDSRRKQDLKSIQAALELYKQTNGSYPSAANWINSAPNGGNWIPGITSTYINQMPSDPNNSSTNCNGSGSFPAGCNTYGYFAGTYCDSTAAGSTYILATRLENSSDPDSGKGIYWAGDSACQWGATPGIYSLTAP